MAKDHFCITTGCSVVSEVCEICGSHSGKEEYRCLLNVTQSSLILTNASQEPAVSTRWMETADSSIMPVYVYYQKCGVMSQKTVIYKEHAASISWRWKQWSLSTVGSHNKYLPECKTILIWDNPPKKCLPKEYVSFQIQDDPANIRSVKKHFTIIMHLFSSHSLLKFPFPSLSFHNISSVPFITLNIQHILKPLTVTSGEMHCHAPMIYSD